jgi:hypothetical protein
MGEQMAARQFKRLSEAYDTLKEFGFDARGIETTEELVQGFQPLRAVYKDQADGRAETYQDVLRPALVAVANAIRKIHPKLHRDQTTRVPSRSRDGKS